MALISSAIGDQSEVVPDGWHTAKQLAREWQVSSSAADRLIEKATVAGIAERRKFRVQVSPDHYYRVTHYRFTAALADPVPPRDS